MTQTYVAILTIAAFLIVAALSAMVADSMGLLNRFKRRPPAPLPALAFETDVQFLHYLISAEINMVSRFIIAPSRMAGTGIMNDRDYTEHQESVVAEVMRSMSPTYMAVMGKYFSPTGLEEYVSKVVMRDFTAEALESNLASMSQVGSRKTVMRM